MSDILYVIFLVISKGMVSYGSLQQHRAKVRIPSQGM